MNISDLINRQPSPIPWAEGDNIPWDEPGFSERMLREHLRQDHDAASRRSEKIDQHVAWIHNQVLSGQPAKILDLGCGPGLYVSRLARLGHNCTGIDFSPASIEYARRQAQQEGQDCTYLHQDIRQAEYGAGYGLVMLLFGEFNIFRPSDAKFLLQKAYAALADGGTLLLEPHTYKAVHSKGNQGATWYSSQGGLFSDSPHVILTENHWDEGQQAATVRYYVVDASIQEVTKYAQSFQAYSEDSYGSLLQECGFEDAKIFPSLAGIEDESQAGMFAITVKKGPTQAT